MAIDLTNNQGYKKEYFTVPKNSVYTIQFGNFPAPNYFRVNNMGTATLYCTTMSMPTDSQYDFKVEGRSVSNFAEPYSRDRLYILNPTHSDIKISVTSWYGEFDPSFLAVGELSFTGDTTLTTDGLVKGFTSSLPAGTNHLGTVTPSGEIMTDLQSGVNAVKDLLSDTHNVAHGNNMMDVLWSLNQSSWNCFNFDYSYLQTLCTNTAMQNQNSQDMLNYLQIVANWCINHPSGAGSAVASAFSLLRPYYLQGVSAERNHLVNTDVGELTRADYVKLNNITFGYVGSTDYSKLSSGTFEIKITQTVNDVEKVIYSKSGMKFGATYIGLLLPSHMEGVRIYISKSLESMESGALTYSLEFEQENGRAYQILTGQEYQVEIYPNDAFGKSIKDLLRNAVSDDTTAVKITGITVNEIPDGYNQIDNVKVWRTTSTQYVPEMTWEVGTLYYGANDIADIVLYKDRDWSNEDGDSISFTTYDYILMGFDFLENIPYRCVITIHYEVIN